RKGALDDHRQQQVALARLRRDRDEAVVAEERSDRLLLGTEATDVLGHRPTVPDPRRSSPATMARMLPDGRRLGAHLAMGDGLVKAADRAVEIGIDALQIFSDNPTAWQRRAAPNPETERFRGVLGEHDIRPLAIHGSYLINLAGWDDTLRERSIELLTSELVAAHRLGASVVNIHTGSHRGTSVDAGIARLVDGVVRALDASATTVAAEPDPDGAATPEPVVALE